MSSSTQFSRQNSRIETKTTPAMQIERFTKLPPSIEKELLSYLMIDDYGALCMCCKTLKATVQNFLRQTKHLCLHISSLHEHRPKHAQIACNIVVSACKALQSITISGSPNISARWARSDEWLQCLIRNNRLTFRRLQSDQMIPTLGTLMALLKCPKLEDFALPETEGMEPDVICSLKPKQFPNLRSLSLSHLYEDPVAARRSGTRTDDEHRRLRKFFEQGTCDL